MLCSTYIHTYIQCIYTQTYVVHRYTILSRNWKYMSHFHVRSSQNTPNEDGYATWTIYDQFRLNIHFHAIIKVFVYKSCDELSLLVQCTTSTFGPAQSCNLKKLKSSFYETKLEIVKMTQINFISRNQLHNIYANSCQRLNFGLSWSG